MKKIDQNLLSKLKKGVDSLKKSVDFTEKRGRAHPT